MVTRSPSFWNDLPRFSICSPAVKTCRAGREIEESSPNESGKSSPRTHTNVPHVRVCVRRPATVGACVPQRTHRGAYENESVRRAPSAAEARSRSQWNSPAKLGHRVSQSAIRRERERTRRATPTRTYARPHDHV